MTFHKPARKTLRDTIIANRQQLAGMAKLAMKEPPVFSELEIPKSKPVYSASEAQILKSILAYLRLHPDVGWFARFNSGAFLEGDRYIQANSQPGLSDILGCLIDSGRLFAIEVKKINGKTQLNQTVFLRTIENAGGLAGICRSIDDVTKLLAG
jgi:hypothetical protein